MCTEGLNLNSAVMPQAGQVTDSAIFMVSICASASWRHWRQFTMSSPSALPMNAKDSESKRGIINSSVPSFFCVLYQQTEGIAHPSAGMRVQVAPFAAGVPLWNVGGTGQLIATFGCDAPHRAALSPMSGTSSRRRRRPNKCGRETLIQSRRASAASPTANAGGTGSGSPPKCLPLL